MNDPLNWAILALDIILAVINTITARNAPSKGRYWGDTICALVWSAGAGFILGVMLVKP